MTGTSSLEEFQRSRTQKACELVESISSLVQHAAIPTTTFGPRSAIPAPSGRTLGRWISSAPRRHGIYAR